MPVVDTGPLQTASPFLGEALAAIHEAAFPPKESWNADVFRTQLGLPGVTGLIHPDGGLVLVRIAADEAEVLTIAVAPPAQRRGIGAALLGQAIAMLREQGAVSIFLEVAVGNEAALALYGRFGFTRVGHRRRYYPDGRDALVLRLDLAVERGGAPADVQS